MLCDQHGSCEFYDLHKHAKSTEHHQMLITSYCKGSLQIICRRIKFQKENGEEAPHELCPNGYRASNHKL
jgi:hypothetical protein